MQETQDSVKHLDNAIKSMAESSKIVDYRVESRFDCLEDKLQNRADRIDRSIGSTAEDSISANHDLESILQYLEDCFHATQMLLRDEPIKDVEKCVE